LLGIVIALHLGLLALIVTTRVVAPQIMATPLIVDLIQPQETEKAPEAKPLPVIHPQPQRQKAVPTPKPPVPTLETTSSAAPSDAAPVAVPAESKASTTTQVSEMLTQARFDADYLRNPAPPYPPLSRRVGEEGKVVLRVSVNPHGNADSVEIKTSSGSSRLDEAARKTVQIWKFIPAKRGETAIQSWVLVPIIFKLEQ
jgi:protein TonB